MKWTPLNIRLPFISILCEWRGEKNPFASGGEAHSRPGFPWSSTLMNQQSRSHNQCQRCQSDSHPPLPTYRLGRWWSFACIRGCVTVPLFCIKNQACFDSCSWVEVKRKKKDSLLPFSSGAVHVHTKTSKLNRQVIWPDCHPVSSVHRGTTWENQTLLTDNRFYSTLMLWMYIYVLWCCIKYKIKYFNCSWRNSVM